MMCVSVDNSQADKSFHPEEDDFSESDDRLDDNVEYSDLLSAADADDSSSYTAGDRISSQINAQNVYNNRWPLRSPDNYGYCSSLNSALFL
jgi:hypothetical protein